VLLLLILRVCYMFRHVCMLSTGMSIQNRHKARYNKILSASLATVHLATGKYLEHKFEHNFESVH